MHMILGANIKPHFCIDTATAVSVFKNLQERYPESAPVMMENVGHRAVLEFAGAHAGQYLYLTFAGGSVVGVISSQWDYFKTAVGKLNDPHQEERYGGKFFKVHGHTHILCLSLAQKEEFISLMDTKSEEYDRISSSTWTSLDNKGL